METHTSVDALALHFSDLQTVRKTLSILHIAQPHAMIDTETKNNPVFAMMY